VTTDPLAVPHDPYISAVVDALEEAGLTAPEFHTDNSDTRGTHCYLSAVIELDPSGVHDIPAEDIPTGTPWPHGLILIWEWHTGIEAHLGEPDRGASWQWAELKEHGVCKREPEPLPVPGWVAPAMLAATAATLIHTRTPTPMGSLWHEHLRAPVQAACETWGAAEIASGE
jgi:hypothetical protein